MPDFETSEISLADHVRWTFLIQREKVAPVYALYATARITGFSTAQVAAMCADLLRKAQS